MSTGYAIAYRLGLAPWVAARAKAAGAGVDVRFLHADVTDMAETVGSGYTFLLDVGCFHGLKPDQRPVTCSRSTR